MNEWKLTDDEQVKVWETGENQDPFVDFERIAHAQAKKLVEWLTHCCGDKPDLHCWECVEQLRKEVGLD